MTFKDPEKVFKELKNLSKGKKSNEEWISEMEKIKRQLDMNGKYLEQFEKDLKLIMEVKGNGIK